ncbi:iron complex outermembrane receptor protein [Hydrogenivirga caldilitoris]|uniref:Iron complex outermembrane receptor protein n=1 Tax=Hydrogenivirga caldilitoris TaxID=246264 RepID=A0A497XPF5_9AQUI|nr:TonB-dependent receptor [Hydrogenivirga caldilitoris]RLJ70151.1 iron complex outermembrane receptor protein [Hydrogenivirga caldilitoris]
MRRTLVLLVAPLSVSFSQELFLEKVEVKAKSEVFTEMEVRESFAKDPGEALSESEGVWKLRKGGIANDVVIRGFSGRNLNVLFDGARIYNACPNRMDPPLFHVDFAEVKSIEVIKGAFDVRNYGSLGGTINIKTLEPKRGFHGKFNIGVGSFSYFNPSLNLSYATDKVYGLAGYSYRYSKPYKTGEGKRFTEYPTGMNAYKDSEKDSTAFSINTAWAKLGFKPAKDSAVELSYTAQRARDVLYPYLMMDSPKDDSDRLNLRLKWASLKVTAYYSYVDHLMNNEKRVNTMFMETSAKSMTYGTKVEYELNNLAVGLEAFLWNWKSVTEMRGMMTSIQSTIPDVDTTDLGIFGEYRKKVNDKTKLVAGLRLDTTETKADKGKANTSLYYAYHNTRDTSERDTYPSGNLQLTYSLGKETELFAGIGYSVRVPDAQERYFALDRMGSQSDWVGNPNLKPSKNTEIDLGVKVKNPKLNLTATLFYSFVKDYITVYNQDKVNPVTLIGTGTQARSYANVDAQLYGGEAKATFAVTETLFLKGGVSYVKGKKDTDPAKNITDEDIAEIPPLKGRLALRYDTGVYFGEVETVAQATQNKVDSDLNETKTSGWAIVNLKTGGEYKNYRITAGVQNLFDKFYYEHLSYLRDPFSSGVKIPGPGRSFYLNLSYVF